MKCKQSVHHFPEGDLYIINICLKGNLFYSARKYSEIRHSFLSSYIICPLDRDLSASTVNIKKRYLNIKFRIFFTFNVKCVD
jgi:hypothetical protein